MKNHVKEVERIGEILRGLPKAWDGKRSILEMKQSGSSHWKQMEWFGFYFQFLCSRSLSDIMQIPGPRYDKVEFDGFMSIPWDFKAHATNTTSHQIIVNDSAAVAHGIRKYGAVGVILAVGEVAYNDRRRSFQKWHEKLKGGLSAYSLERIKRGAWSRLRKVSFDLRQISFIRITDETLVKCGSFQRGFRNAGGQPRKGKVLLDLEKIDEERIYFVEF